MTMIITRNMIAFMPNDTAPHDNTVIMLRENPRGAGGSENSASHLRQPGAKAREPPWRQFLVIQTAASAAASALLVGWGAVHCFV